MTTANVDYWDGDPATWTTFARNFGRQFMVDGEQPIDLDRPLPADQEQCRDHWHGQVASVDEALARSIPPCNEHHFSQPHPNINCGQPSCPCCGLGIVKQDAVKVRAHIARYNPAVVIGGWTVGQYTGVIEALPK